MRCLTIKEPYASCILKGYKKIETRSWKTNYRGKIYIHAGNALVNLKDDKIKNICNMLNNELNYGKIILEANLIDCRYMDDDFIKEVSNNNTEYYLGRYEIGRYGWILDDIKVIEPINAKGMLGIWRYME